MKRSFLNNHRNYYYFQGYKNNQNCKSWCNSVKKINSNEVFDDKVQFVNFWEWSDSIFIKMWTTLRSNYTLRRNIWWWKKKKKKEISSKKIRLKDWFIVYSALLLFYIIRGRIKWKMEIYRRRPSLRFVLRVDSVSLSYVGKIRERHSWRNYVLRWWTWGGEKNWKIG